jgi:hypothetical protein
MNQTPQKMNTMNTKHEPNNMGSKTYQIWYKRRHIHVGNHLRINNLTSNHFGFYLNNMILSK